MPIYKGRSLLTGDSHFIRDLLKGNEQIRRIYKNNQLCWGFYDINYYYGKELPETVSIVDEIENYVWGLEYELPTEEGSALYSRKLVYTTLSQPENYFHKYYGWYSDNIYNTPVPDVLTKDYHKDLDLFAQWKQKRFTYSGTAYWETWEEGGGGGSWAIRTSKPTQDTDPSGYYDWGSSFEYACTWYCNGRAYEATGRMMPNGDRSWGDAEDWPVDGDLSAGNIVVMDGPKGGHVIFLERVNSDGSLVTSCTAFGYGISWAAGELDPGKSHYVPGWGTYTVKGYSNNPNGEGGGGHWKGHERPVSETACTDQQNPSAPLPSDISGEHNAKWKSLTKDTYMRTCVYSLTGVCSWPDWTNKEFPGTWETITWPDTGAHKVTISSSNDLWGTTTGSGYYRHGEVITISVSLTNPERYKFVKWSDGDTNATRSITVNSDITLKANVEVNIDWDIDVTTEYEEINLLNTTDVHGYWVGYETSSGTKYKYTDIRDMCNTLKTQNILAYGIDCGDWSHGSDKINASQGKDASDQMNACNYIAAVYGNHEWKWGSAATTMTILNRLNCITACNLIKSSTGNLIFKPYRAIRTGNIKVAIIGVGFPAANADGHDYQGYHFMDSTELYNQVQHYIDLFKEADVYNILVIAHMCTNSTVEYDDRYIARCDSLIKNTNGLKVVCPGHLNATTAKEYISDKFNNKVLLAPEAGTRMNCYGRIRFYKGGSVTAELVT